MIDLVVFLLPNVERDPKFDSPLPINYNILFILTGNLMGSKRILCTRLLRPRPRLRPMARPTDSIRSTCFSLDH